jgi:hypothetical protein
MRALFAPTIADQRSNTVMLDGEHRVFADTIAPSR